MKINNIVYPSFNSTDGLSVDIFLSGCRRDPHCKGCHNPSLWSFDSGDDVNYETLIAWLKSKKGFYDNIAILGGEPLHQENLGELLQKIYRIKPIWLYTSYEIEDVPEDIKKYCKYIKTGQYIEEMKVSEYTQYGICLATSNQKIIKVR